MSKSMLMFRKCISPATVTLIKLPLRRTLQLPVFQLTISKRCCRFLFWSPKIFRYQNWNCNYNRM